MSGLSEEDIRRIIREEMTELMKSLARTADFSNGYETGELEGAALRAIGTVAEAEADQMPHAWDCERRTKRYWFECTCGIDEKDENDA